VGAALLEAGVDWARTVAAAEVVLHVFPTNTAALALYRHHGFEERERLPGACRRTSGERWDAIRMTRPLHPAAAQARRPELHAVG